MAGYYDKNKDYSKELQRTDLSASERDRLTKERQNKINDKYGGREPNMIGSDKTYSQTYNKGGNRRDTSSSGSSQAVSGGTPYVKGPGYGTGGYTTPGIYGAANLQPTDMSDYWKKMTGGADMSRRPDLAGGYSISNGYTILYDENGYAKKAVKGVADYTPHQDINAGNGTYSKNGAWTDNEMMSAADRQKIADIRAQMQSGKITGDQANQAANAIRAGYGYTIDKNGYVTDSGALSSVNDLRRRLGLENSPESAELAYYRYLMGTDTSPTAQASGKVQSFGDYLAENGGAQAGTPGYGTPAYSQQQRVTDINAGNVPVQNPGTAQTGMSFDIGDGSDYLKELYAKKVAAELAALKSAYEQNTATLDASRAQIAPVYDIARNSAANQNALSRGAFQEMAVANGLNTGTTGQAALAQDVVLQQNLSQIDREQAEKTAAIDLQRSQLDTEYRNAIAKAEATGDAELANALYEEYVRQQNLYAKYGGQTGGSGSGSSGGSTVVKPTLTVSQVQSALKNGIVTDDVISAFDYYYGQGAYDSLYGTGRLTAGTTGTAKTGSSTGKKKGSYSNGSLTNQQVKQLQKYYGVSQDGKWGANSKKAAGGLTADQAWAKYQGGGSSGKYENVGNLAAWASGLNTDLKNGNTEKVGRWLDNNWSKLTAEQQRRINAEVLKPYGIVYKG